MLLAFIRESCRVSLFVLVEPHEIATVVGQEQLNVSDFTQFIMITSLTISLRGMRRRLAG